MTSITIRYFSGSRAPRKDRSRVKYRVGQVFVHKVRAVCVCTCARVYVCVYLYVQCAALCDTRSRGWHAGGSSELTANTRADPAETRQFRLLFHPAAAAAVAAAAAAATSSSSLVADDVCNFDGAFVHAQHLFLLYAYVCILTHTCARARTHIHTYIYACM